LTPGDLPIMLRPTVRKLLAIVAFALIALSIAAPHVHHAGPYGSHACQACVVRAAEEAGCATPDVAPPSLAPETIPAAPGLPPVCGLPLGAVPGQSPPRA
jgi:hypothetical protein